MTYNVSNGTLNPTIPLTHALLKGIISNNLDDLEWVSEIFSDTMQRAAFLRQLSLLSKYDRGTDNGRRVDRRR